MSRSSSSSWRSEQDSGAQLSSQPAREFRSGREVCPDARHGCVPRTAGSKPFPVVQDDLALPGVDPGMFQASKTRSCASMGCCPSGESIHSRKSSRNGPSSKDVSRAACPSDEDSTAGHCRREAHDRVMVGHKEFNGLTVISGVTDNVHQKQQRAGPMSLWMPWWNAIWRLRPAFSACEPSSGSPPPSRVSPCGRNAGRDLLVRALNLDARYYKKLVDHFHSPAVKLIGWAVDPDWCCGLFPQPCASMAASSSSVTASRCQSAAARCRRSNNSINSPSQTPSQNI